MLTDGLQKGVWRDGEMKDSAERRRHTAEV